MIQLPLIVKSGYVYEAKLNRHPIFVRCWGLSRPYAGAVYDGGRVRNLA